MNTPRHRRGVPVFGTVGRALRETVQFESSNVLLAGQPAEDLKCLTDPIDRLIETYE